VRRTSRTSCSPFLGWYYLKIKSESGVCFLEEDKEGEEGVVE